LPRLAGAVLGSLTRRSTCLPLAAAGARPKSGATLDVMRCVPIALEDPVTAPIGARVAVICRWTHFSKSKIKTFSIGWLENGAVLGALPIRRLIG